MHSDLDTLEFDAIRRILARLTSTPYGDEAARGLEPAPDIALAQCMQAAVTAARQVVDAGEQPNLGQVPDIRAAMRQVAQAGSALSAQALHHIRSLSKMGALWQRLVADYRDLYAQPECLQAPDDLLSAIDRVVNAQGRLREDATAEHVELYRLFHAQQAEIQHQLKEMMQDAAFKGVFSGSESVQWHGVRAVLAVKTAFADRIKGVRRGNVAGGREVLMEPMVVIAGNNRLETLNGQIEAQNQRILRETADVVRLYLPALQQMIDAMAWVDLALAAGQFSAAMNASAPMLVAEAKLSLQQAYHPQLLLQFQQRQVQQLVPLTVTLDTDSPMLVITGPNTGGKTVVLKTVGVLVTMAHCGLHIPAEGLCVIGDFSRVIIDVGDKQSLHHHLSTFAGHVAVLRRLLDEADARTLVLLDELGTGTDPEEGASLAMAVLDELASRQVRGIVTTHLSPLKVFASEHAWLRNASMRFDHEHLTPTYQLELGKPGQSLGLIIAEKNGLPAPLLAHARIYLARLQQGGFDVS